MTSTVPASCTASCCARRTGMRAIEGIDTAAARAMPGVMASSPLPILMWTASGTLPCIAQVATVAPMIVPPRRALARDRVRHVGDPVAFVVADTANQARDAAERIAVAYRPLPTVVDTRRRSPLRRRTLGRSAGQSVATGSSAATSRRSTPRLRGAAQIVEIELVNNRLVVAPIEPRAAIGRSDADAKGSPSIALVARHPVERPGP